jgi:DNA polymerase III epsilon subunit-like protein
MKFEPNADSVLIFDIEARPTAWIGGDYVGRTMTAFAFKYLGSDVVRAEAIYPGDREHWQTMVVSLASALESSDLVVGHYIRGFDLDVVNADLERVKQATLPRLMTNDTKIDRLKGLGISESLENLSARYDLETEKFGMKEPWWEEFNCWQTPESRQTVLTRVKTDVVETEELYLALLEAGRLKSPEAWDPATAKRPRYRS